MSAKKIYREGLPGEGPPGATIAFVCTTPKFEDKYKGQILAGNDGKFFNWALAQAKLYRHQVHVTSWVSVPSTGMDFRANKEKELGDLKREIAELIDAGLKIIVTMGEAKDAFGIFGKLDAVRGSLFTWADDRGREVFVLPTYEVWQIHSRGKVNRGGDKANFKFVWIADMVKAKEILSPDFTLPKEDFILDPTFEQAKEFLTDATQRQALLALDIETHGGFSRDHIQIAMIGLATSTEKGICVPLAGKDKLPYWQNGQEKEIKALLNLAFAVCPLMLQNALFDVPVLNMRGFTVPWPSVVHDTMLLHHALNPELPHNIGFIVSVYGATPYWKEDFLGRLGSIFDMDYTEAQRYNVRDCVVLHQVLGPMLQDLAEEGQEGTYRENMSMLGPIDEMTSTGVLVDTSFLAKWKREKAKEVARLESQMYELAKLPEAFNFRSTDDKRFFFYGIEPAKFAKLAELSEFEEKDYVKYLCKNDECAKKTFFVLAAVRSPCPKCMQMGEETSETKTKSPRKKGTKVHEELLAVAQIRDFAKPLYIPPNYEPPLTGNDDAAVGSQAMLSLQVAVQNRIESRRNLKVPATEEIAQAERFLDFLQLYGAWNSLQKLLTFPSAYVPAADGRVHPSFLIHGTSTGRLSCANPNLQQIPKREKEIRKAFIAAPQHVIMSADFENLEVHVLAYETKDEALVEMISQGINIHDENTKILFQIDSSHEHWQIARGASKIFMFGGISYGGSDRGIYEKVILAAPKLGLTFRQFVEAKVRWMEKHKSYAKWKEQVQSKALRERKTSTFLGRTRILTGQEHEILRQALNTPIQGGAGGIFNRCLVSLYQEKRERQMRAKLILAIHDQIVMEVPEGEIPAAADMLQRHMTQVFDFYGTPRQFVTEVEVGPSLGQLEKYEQGSVI